MSLVLREIFGPNISRPTEQVEYMAFPRMLAMSEVVWSGASEDIETGLSDFLSQTGTFYGTFGCTKYQLCESFI